MLNIYISLLLCLHIYILTYNSTLCAPSATVFINSCIIKHSRILVVGNIS